MDPAAALSVCSNVSMSIEIIIIISRCRKGLRGRSEQVEVHVHVHARAQWAGIGTLKSSMAAVLPGDCLSAYRFPLTFRLAVSL